MVTRSVMVTMCQYSLSTETANGLSVLQRSSDSFMVETQIWSFF